MIFTEKDAIEDHLSLRQLFAGIAEYAAESDCDGCFPEQEFRLLRESGFLTITLPDQPLRFDQQQTVPLLQLLKSIGKASLPVGRIYEGHINALYLISLFGEKNQKARWYADAYENLFGVWNTQDAAGLEIHDLGNGLYRLNGSKTFCSGGGWIGRPLVTGKLVSATRTGWQMCIIPTEEVKPIQEDNSFWAPLGMRASASFKMDFTGIEITEKDLLGPPNAYYQQPYFGGGALRFAAVQLGGAEAILEETHRFLNEMGRAEDSFQQTRMAEISYLTETGNLWINQAASNYDKWDSMQDSTDKLLAYVHMTRTAMEDICLRSMQLAEKSVGSRGLMRPGIMERLHRDLTTYLRQPAPDAAQMAIGKYVLDQQNTTSLWH